MSVELIGLDEVLDRLEELADVAELKMNMKKACALVEKDAKKNAPKGTGELRRSITSRVEADADEVVGLVFTPLEYAPYVEYGTGLFAEGGNGRKDVPWNYQDDEGNWHSTSGMEPRPFMRPALKENRTQILKILKEGLVND
jgi:HK97 gp10 family phage protein